MHDESWWEIYEVELIYCIKWCMFFFQMLLSICCIISFEYSGEWKKQFTMLSNNEYFFLLCFLIICISWCKVIPCLFSERLATVSSLSTETLFWNGIYWLGFLFRSYICEYLFFFFCPFWTKIWDTREEDLKSLSAIVSLRDEVLKKWNL